MMAPSRSDSAPTRRCGIRFASRSPAGVESMLADLLGYPIAVEAVGVDGSFVYDAGSRRFIADVAGVSHDVGAAHGKVVWNGSGWTVALGRSLFNIVP